MGSSLPLLYLTSYTIAYRKLNVIIILLSLWLSLVGEVLITNIHSYTLYHITHTQTKQSEMTNTSPAICQCLATFTPLKWKMLTFFRDVISLLARVFIFVIDRDTQEVPMKNIWKKLSVQSLRYTPLNCQIRCLLTRHDITYVRYIFIRSTLTYREYYTKVCNDSLNITIVMGSQRS